LDEAAKLLTEYLAQHPNDKDALLDLARIEVARGASNTAPDLLQRYRDAGGDELIYRRELSEVLAHPTAPLKAEMRTLDDAERLYRELLAKDPKRVDLMLRLVDVLSAQDKRRRQPKPWRRRPICGRTTAICSCRPRRRSEPPTGRPTQCDTPIRALAIRPADEALQRRRAQLATWAGNLCRGGKKPAQPDRRQSDRSRAEADLGRVLGWQNHLDEAAKLLSEYCGATSRRQGCAPGS